MELSSTPPTHTENTRRRPRTVSVGSTIQQEATKIHEFIVKMAPGDEVLSEYFR